MRSDTRALLTVEEYLSEKSFRVSSKLRGCVEVVQDLKQGFPTRDNYFYQIQKIIKQIY